MPIRSVRDIIQQYKQRTTDSVNELRELIVKGGVVALIATVIIWVAIFLYIAFYYAYMPSITHVRPVHLQFKSCVEEKGICSFPSAHVQLTKRQQLLMVGQQYKMYLDLEMPESPANKRLGMFMVCMRLHDKDNFLVDDSCRSAMLHYRSYLLHLLTTIFYSPMLVLGSTEEKQNIKLELFADFEEDQNHPVTDVFIEIQSRRVELYSSTLHIHAHFTGLRYLMFHWPLFSAAVGITTNLFFIVLIITLSWWRLHKPTGDTVDFLFGAEENENVEEECLSETNDSFEFKGEVEDSSFEDASLLEESGNKNEEGDAEVLQLVPGSQQYVEAHGSESFQLLETSTEEIGTLLT